MESVGILRALWRRRLLVGLGALIACAVALHSAYSISPTSMKLESLDVSSGVAVERVLVNTPTSLIADARAKGAASITVRSIYLADLLAGDEARAMMAKGLGVNPSQIAVINTEDALPQTPNPLAEKAIEVAVPRAPYVVSVSADPNLPILSIHASAPDERKAAALAREATATLRPISEKALSPTRTVRIDRQGKAEIGTKQFGPGKAKAVIIGLVLFTAWCAAVILLDRLLQRRRTLPGWPVTGRA